MTTCNADLGRRLVHLIRQCVKANPANVSETGDHYFDQPLVGFAAADDELFEMYRKVIGPFHWTPAQVLARAYPGGGVEARSVISWVLPIIGGTRLSNRREERYPSRRWARTRHYGELFNDVIRKALVDYISDHGGHAAAPMLLDGWSRVNDPGIGWASTWSERHAAYAAGLGTFSLNDGFITTAGIAHRTGSVVTDLPVKPSPRSFSDHRENCLACRGMECGVCITRCPAGAISWQGHDKALCHEYTYGSDFKELSERYGAEHVGCGLCQTNVPCEDRIPEGKNSNRS